MSELSGLGKHSINSILHAWVMSHLTGRAVGNSQYAQTIVDFPTNFPIGGYVDVLHDY